MKLLLPLLRFSGSVKLNYDLNNNKLEPFHRANRVTSYISRFAVILSPFNSVYGPLRE